MADREFTEGELSDLIRLAARRQRQEPHRRVTYEEVLAIGRDLGLEPGHLHAAMGELDKVRKERHRRVRRKMGFFRHLAVYGTVVTGLFLIYLISGGGHPWPLYPAVGWGIAVAIQGFSVYFHEKEAMIRETL